MKTINGATLLEPIRDDDALIAIHRLFAGEHLVAEVGQRISRRSWLARERPECFVRVVPEGLDRAEAMVCTREIDVQDTTPGAAPWQTRRLVWPQQWLPKDHRLVSEFPERFVPVKG